MWTLQLAAPTAGKSAAQLPALNPGINVAQLAAALAAQLAGQGIQPPGPAVQGAQPNQGDGAPPVPNALNAGDDVVV